MGRQSHHCRKMVKFHLKFEIADWKNVVKFAGRTFLPARKALEISGRTSEQISEKISGTSFHSKTSEWRDSLGTLSRRKMRLGAPGMTCASGASAL